MTLPNEMLSYFGTGFGYPCLTRSTRRPPPSRRPAPT